MTDAGKMPAGFESLPLRFGEETTPETPHEIARIAMINIMGERRVPTSSCSPSGVCEPCIAPHVQKLAKAVEEEKPLQLMLLGFPCKSPNPDKVLGELPDMAELLSLTHLNSLATRIHSFYKPGAEIVIGADGRLFTDLVEVPDKVVSSYIKGVRKLIHSTGLSVTYTGIDELMPELANKAEYDRMREEVASAAEPTEVLRKKASEDPEFMYQVNGMQKFLMDDLGHVLPDLSKNQLKKTARNRAYEIIARGDVLRKELEKQFPNAVRLSIHPQATHSGKLGIHLTPSHKDQRTPWHSTALQQEDGSYRLTRRRDAQEQGAEIVYDENSQPSHMAMTN